MTILRDALLSKPLPQDSVRLWYNEDESREKGRLVFKFTDEYLAQETYMALLNERWLPVRADEAAVIRRFADWLNGYYRQVPPDRDQLRRAWFVFCEQEGIPNSKR